MTEQDENILLSLLALGFEHEDCVNVIQNGVKNVEDAVSLLVNGTVRPMGGQSGVPPGSSPGPSAAACSQDTDFAQRNKQLKDSYNEQLRKRKQEESSVRERVRENFKADRMKQKDKKNVRNCTNPDSSESSSLTAGSSASKEACDPNTEKKGRIRVRLPNGQSIQLSFSKDTFLQDVLDSALASVEDSSLSFTLMQPFPRKEYTTADMQASLGTLNLFPSASLVLHIPVHREENTEMDTDTNVLSDENMSADEEVAGHGCAESRLLAGNMDNEINDMDMDDTHGEASHIHHMKRHIDSLQLLSAKSVAHNLTVLETKTVNSMVALSSKSATLVIDVLKSWKMLSPKLMSTFIPCRLKEMHLDSYGLAANELLEKLRFHKTITVLSLKSCHLLNDYAVNACLQRLRGIKFLNLSDCCRLTGNVLQELMNLAPLEVLILDKLKISDENVNHFMQSHQLENLKKLSFDFCPLSSLAFSGIKICSSLVSLSLNNTQVVELSFLQSFPNLVKLDLQNTQIVDLELGHVRRLNHLKSLKLRGTNISGDGLWYLNGMQLTYINTADRQTVTNETIAMLSAFPLQTLDLSDHIYLTDTCVPSIAKILSLTNLSLSNTKITDEHLSLLVELINLLEVDLSKTVVTNNVTSLMTSLPLLHTMNLAWTKVDDNCIVNISSCLQLSKLNLSHTDVTDKGIVKMRSSSLVTLILDATAVTWRGAEVCFRECPNLKLLRNNETRVLISR